MNLSNNKRLRKLLGNLLVNPDLIPNYFRHNILKKQLPIDLELPWWSYRAIEYVDKIVQGKRIFEYGTGGSTLRFSKKANYIVAVEDDEKWVSIIKDRLDKSNISNVNISYCPFDFHNPKNFEKSDYLRMVDSGNFDIIIIDGQDWTFRERIKCFRYVESRMQSGQFIIVDDFWRYEELSNSHNAKNLNILESVGPCRYGVTSTAVFSY